MNVNKKLDDFVQGIYGKLVKHFDITIYYIDNTQYADYILGAYDLNNRNKSEVNLTLFQLTLNNISIKSIFDNLIKDIGRGEILEVINYKYSIMDSNLYNYSSYIQDPSRTFVYIDVNNPNISKPTLYKLPNILYSDTIWYLSLNKDIGGRFYYEFENSIILKLLNNDRYSCLNKSDCEWLNIPYEENLLIMYKNTPLY